MSAIDAPPERLSFGNTIKKAAAIRDAAARGVTRFAFDSAQVLPEADAALDALGKCFVSGPLKGVAFGAGSSIVEQKQS